MKRLVACLAVLALILASCRGEDLVPLLGVSNCDALSTSQSVSHGADMYTVLSQVDIEELDVVIVMEATKLSFDDIARYGGVYGEKNASLSGLRHSLSSSPSSLSAGVSGQSASDLTSMLSFAMDTKPLVISDVTQLPEFSGSGHHLVVMELPEAMDEETFAVHDSIFTQLKSLLDSSLTKYAIFYTSDHCSISPVGKRSSFKQYSYPTHYDSPKCYEVRDDLNYTSCIVFCFTKPYIMYSTDNQTMLLGNGEEGIRYERGSCNSTASLPELEEFQTNTTFAFIMFHVEGNTTEGEPPLRKSLVFTFENGTCDSEGTYNNMVGCGFWTMRMYAGEGPKELTEYHRYRPNGRIFSMFSVPLGASYSCGNCSLNKYVSVSSASSNDSYRLSGIQVQAFTKTVTNDNNEIVFASAYHCQGYTDPSLWMISIAVIPLAIILYTANVAAFSLQSPNLFDDPRNPTITVENLH